MVKSCYGGIMDKKKILAVVGFVVLAVVAVALRLLYISTPLWYDEACSWFTAIQAFPMGIIDNLLQLDLQHTPLYFFLLHFWIKVFGDGEIALKSLSLMFGIAALPLVYTAVKKLASQKMAVWGLILASVSPLMVYFSTEVRMYPAAVFLVMLSINYLIDFNDKADTNSLVKLIIANVLLPYTLVGGILYNISLFVCYGSYLFRQRKDLFSKYIKACGTELLLLIPYFCLVFYYARMRSLFVIRHEGELHFFNIIDILRNFFGSNLVNNIYWPSMEPYVISFSFTMLVIVPCVYFVYGLVQGFKYSEGFIKSLYALIFMNFCLFIVCSYMQVNVLTVRYILYLFLPMLILAMIGLSKRISSIHFKGFLIFFAACSIFSCIQYSEFSYGVKGLAFKSVKTEAVKFGLTSEDIILMPFGADAPYYFRAEGSPRVFNFDFHKEVRNPYNSKYYDEEQMKFMDKEAKYRVIYDAIFADSGFSQNHYEYFKKNVIDQVESGRYVLLALYASDSSSLVTLPELKKSISSIQDIKDNCLEVMLKKYLYDIRYYLTYDFNFLGLQNIDNYMYLIFQKK